jgi:hypothetical protein
MELPMGERYARPSSADRCSMFSTEFSSDLLRIMETLYLSSQFKIGFFDR